MLAAAAVSAAEDRAGGQGGLFGDAEPSVRTALPTASAWNGQQKLDEEFAATGFFLSGHPLDDVLDSLEDGRITLTAEIGDVAVDGRPLELIGVVRRRVEKLSRSGGKFALLTLSDTTGVIELMVMPEALENYRHLLDTGSSVCVTVNVRRQDEEIRLSAKKVTPIDKARIGKKAKALIVRLSRGANYSEIASVAERLVSAPGADRGAIYLDLPLEDGRMVTMKLPETYATGLEALRALKMASGVARVDTRAA
ncbi:MAG: OB-fold nucleic acid binding domain-containing protein [Pseudomonadota bacterium]|nr:OB-fold nucleic acid binding domain-containing protein [Pseudomonadota bacterium]